MDFQCRKFGIPQFSTVFKSQIRYLLWKIHFLMDYQCRKFGIPQFSTVFKSQIWYFLWRINFFPESDERRVLVVRALRVWGRDRGRGRALHPVRSALASG